MRVATEAGKAEHCPRKQHECERETGRQQGRLDTTRQREPDEKGPEEELRATAAPVAAAGSKIRSRQLHAAASASSSSGPIVTKPDCAPRDRIDGDDA